LVEELWTPGSGIIIRVRNKHFLSGPTQTFSYEATKDDPLGTVVFVGADFNCIIYDANAWPVPSQAINLQTTASNDIRTAKAETLMRAYINANIGPSAPTDRKGYYATKLVMGTDNGLGPTMTKSPRFTNLGTLSAEIGAFSGITFEVQYRNEDLILVTRKGADRSAFVRFDLRNGNLASESIQVTPPTVTRAIVAGQEEGVNRQLLMRTSSASLAAEVSWRRKIEQFIDQRQTSDLTELNQAGDEAVTAGGMSTTGVKAVPTDTTNGVFAVDWDLGDMVSVVINGEETDTYITEVALISNSAGTGVGASIGDVTTFLEGTTLANQVSSIDNRVSNLERNAESGSTMDLIRLTSTVDASLSSTGQALQIGPTNGTNLIIDNNEMMARNNGAESPLYLNQDGGDLGIGNSNSLVSIPGTLRNPPSVLGAGQNLNSYVTSGVWYQNANANATTALNYPEAKAGLLEVFGSASGTLFAWQRYSLYGSGIPVVYFRNNYSGTWGPWTLIYSDSGWVTSGFASGSGSTSVGSGAIRRVGITVSVTLNSIVVSPAVSVTIFGDLTNTQVAKVPAGFEPARDQVLSTYGNGALAAFYITSTGYIYLSAIAPASTWTGTTTWSGTVSCGGTYFID